MLWWRNTLVAAALSLLGTQAASAQQAPDPQVTPGPEEPPAERPGSFRLGPLYLTPRLRIGTIGIDTNVFYTATERRTDFTAAGGPGLDLDLPMKSLLLTVAGGVDYLYFLRTVSQRRWAGDGKARLGWLGNRASAGIEASYIQSFSRPNFEVDRRVAQEERRGRTDFRLRVGQRFWLTSEATVSRLEVEADQTFVGADLRRSLSRDTYVAALGLSYRLTSKTAALIEADHQVDQFLLDRLRDADSNRLGGGLQVTSRTRLSGKAVAGARSFRPRRLPTEQDVIAPYAQVDLTYHFGPRTRLGMAYSSDIYYSALSPTGSRPTIRMETYRARLEKGLVSRLDLRTFAGLTRLKNDAAIRIETGPGQATAIVRDDDAREIGADLGYLIRHIRIGIAAAYTERRSNIADFGIHGLLVGGTITYVP